MDQIEIGKFIARCRKEKGLTQAQLAEKLDITDRAVSKWETGKSMPDASIMLELCKILGITVNELLSGEKISVEQYEKKADENLIRLKRNAESSKAKNMLLSILFSGTLFAAALVCLICNIAVSGSLTWSRIPVASIIFAWAVLFPGIILGKKGTMVSFVSLSILIVPYLFLLSRLIKVKEVFSVGAVLAAASVVFLWIIAAVIRRMGKTRKFAAAGITCLLTILLVLAINILLSKMIAVPVLDEWDMLAAAVLLILALVFLKCDNSLQKKLLKQQ